MKKILLPFLSLTGLGFSAWAQSHINIELLSATYTAPAVQFRVSWNSIPAADGETHHSKIWLWVDFIEIKNNQPSGTWTRATVSSPSPGTVAPETTKGFWLQGNSGSYNQIVTVALPDITPNTKFNWCAYASDCPPNVTATNGMYTFKGTPPFTLIASGGTATQTVTGTTLAASALTVTPTTIRDKTECPGVFCIYTGSDLYIDVDHLCQQRASGAQNWEAWIKDTRDDELYRIVLMPDNNWWLAQNVKYAGTGSSITISGCTPEICGRNYTSTEVKSAQGGTSGYGQGIQGVCPNGWILPTLSDWTLFFDGISPNRAEACKHIRCAKSFCTEKPNTYGWADQLLLDQANTTKHETRWANTSEHSYIFWDMNGSGANSCGATQLLQNETTKVVRPARCFRQL